MDLHPGVCSSYGCMAVLKMPCHVACQVAIETLTCLAMYKLHKYVRMFITVMFTIILDNLCCHNIHFTCM